MYTLSYRCSVVYCDIPNTWQNMLQTWFNTAHSNYALTKGTLKVLQDVLLSIVPPTLQYIEQLNSVMDNGLDSTAQVKVLI